MAVFDNPDDLASAAKRQKLSPPEQDSSNSSKEIQDGNEKIQVSSSSELTSWQSIVDMCVVNLEKVKNVYQHHYKSLHMLAAFFMGKHSKHDPKRAREYLLFTGKTLHNFI